MLMYIGLFSLYNEPIIFQLLWLNSKSFKFQNLCSGGTCINTLGAFKCECLDGFTLGPDGRTCTDSVQVWHRLAMTNSKIFISLFFYLNENENKINWFKGLCYATFDAGRCFNPSINMISKSTCCCGSLVFNAPFGWGTPCQVIYNNFSIKYLINLHMTLWLFLDAKSHF